MGRDLRKERFWRGHLERCSRSDLAVRAYCNREGLSEGSFYWWRRELAARGKGDLAACETGGAFARLEVIDALHTPRMGFGNDAVTVEFPDGVCVRLSSSVDESLLRSVLSALRESSPC